MRWSPRGSALDRAMNPETWAWGLAEHLQAAVFDALQIANWQRGQAKQKDFPRPIVRPGVEPPEKKIGVGAIPMDDMARALGWSVN